MSKKIPPSFQEDSSFHDSLEKLTLLTKTRLEFLMQTDLTVLPKPSQLKRKKLTAPVGQDEMLADLLQIQMGDCKRCKLHQGRTNLVFGVGNPNADLVFVGEAPGADEDRLGEPFIGRAGKLLTKMILAMGFTREEIYICNVVKCRPPSNRDPEPDEVEACEPFLKKQLAILNPKVIVTLGRYAGQCLTKTTLAMSKFRGQWQTYENIPLMPTFHPAYLLRSPSKKKETWEDLQAVLKKMKRPLVGGTVP